MTRTRNPLRRLALALATAQLLAYAVAPALEAATEKAPGPVHVEQPQTGTCTPVHAPDACLACQLLTLHAQAAVDRRADLIGEERAAFEAGALTTIAPRAPPTGLLTRAPPTRLA